MANPDIMPGAQYRPLAEGEPPAMSRYDIICLHTMWGYLWGTDSMFHDEGWSGTESHFGVGGLADGADDDGRILQWVPCDRKADANLEGNHHIISIETSDGAKVVEWSANQIESIAQICAWACKRYNIPAALIPDSKPGRRGIGYHRHGINNWRVDGGELWSSSTGKICPNDLRIAQVPQVIARTVELLGGAPPTTPSTPPSTSAPSTFSLSFDGGGSMTLRMIKPASPDMHGTDVKSWQRLLADRGYSPGSIDGYWGDKSDKALRSFQQAKGLTVDGILGPGSGERLLEG